MGTGWSDREPDTEAGLHEYPDTDVVVDVGGRDIKLIFLKDGRVHDFKLNTQCSAGNGYFLQATAGSFGFPVDAYAEIAFSAKAKPEFSSGCEVFMQSDIVDFQRRGWQANEIMAGLVTVLPRNIWHHVARIPNPALLGRRFVLQGGLSAIWPRSRRRWTSCGSVSASKAPSARSTCIAIAGGPAPSAPHLKPDSSGAQDTAPNSSASKAAAGSSTTPARQMAWDWGEELGIAEDESRRAVDQGLRAVEAQYDVLRDRQREVLDQLQRCGYPIFWQDALPTDPDVLDRLFGAEIRGGEIASALEITDVWKNSYSENSSRKLWAAKYVARHPNLVAVELSSFKCGHDAPVYSAVEEIVESTGTPYFCFKDIDENKPAGSIKIRTETIAYFLEQYGHDKRRILREGIS